MLFQEAAGSVVGLVKSVRKHWTLVLAVSFLGAGLGLLYAKTQARVYQAASLVEIDSHAAQPLGNRPGATVIELGSGDTWESSREYYETQYKIIASDRVLEAVARDLNLASDWDFFGQHARPEAPPSLENTTRTLRTRVTVEPVKYSRLVYVKVEDTEPARAKRICDAVAAAYIEQNLQNAVSATTDAVAWLGGQLDHVKLELDQDENALSAFKRTNDLPSTSINEVSNMLRIEMQELDLALTHTRTKKEELQARYAELATVVAENVDVLPASELLSSAFLGTLRAQYQEAVRARIALIGSGKGENHPDVRGVDEKIAETKAALLSEVHNIQGAVERDLAIVTREEAGNAKLFENTRRQAVDLNMKEIEYHRLDRSREQNEKLFGMLLERMKEADLTRMMRVNNIRVVDVAKQPRAPIRPQVPLDIGLGLFVGLALGMAGAWIKDQLDSSMKTPDDIEKHLSLTFLGLLPDVAENHESGSTKRRRRQRRRRSPTTEQPGLLELSVHAHPLSGIAEAARAIRTNLIFMNPDQPHRRILMTSAAPTEGKTMAACSIAIAFAQGGQRVCIVDCDMRRPRLHRIFGRTGDAGVTNVLIGDASVDDVAKATGIENLWSVPAGPTPPNPADILHSARFRKFLDELSERFDRIILDSPPLVAVTDSAIISTLCDGVVFVVRAFETSRQLGAQGLRSLRDVEAPILGAILNAVDLSRHEYTAYYHYYYYKGDGYRETTKEPGDGDGMSAQQAN